MLTRGRLHEVHRHTRVFLHKPIISAYLVHKRLTVGFSCSISFIAWVDVPRGDPTDIYQDEPGRTIGLG